MARGLKMSAKVLLLSLAEHITLLYFFSFLPLFRFCFLVSGKLPSVTFAPFGHCLKFIAF